MGHSNKQVTCHAKALKGNKSFSHLTLCFEGLKKVYLKIKNVTFHNWEIRAVKKFQKRIRVSRII